MKNILNSKLSFAPRNHWSVKIGEIRDKNPKITIEGIDSLGNAFGVIEASISGSSTEGGYSSELASIQVYFGSIRNETYPSLWKGDFYPAKIPTNAYDLVEAPIDSYCEEVLKKGDQWIEGMVETSYRTPLPSLEWFDTNWIEIISKLPSEGSFHSWNPETNSWK